MEIKDVRLPVQLQRAMAAEAEATREAKAKVSISYCWSRITMRDRLRLKFFVRFDFVSLLEPLRKRIREYEDEVSQVH